MDRHQNYEADGWTELDDDNCVVLVGGEREGDAQGLIELALLSLLSFDMCNNVTINSNSALNRIKVNSYQILTEFGIILD